MSQVLLVGDCHGYEGVLAADRLAKELGVDAIILLGDVWDIDLNRPEPIIPMEIILGNHERWPLVAQNKTGKGITIHHDYTTFFLGDRKFGCLGHIDDTPAVRDLIDLGLWLGEPDKIFFARLEGQQIRDLLGGIDVLLTHDAPFPFTLGHRPLPATPNYKGAGPIEHTEVIGSEYLNEVIRTVEPKLAFHAHMHLLDIRYIKQTRVYGLPPIDPSFQHRGYAILDTTTMRAEYHDL